MYGIISQAKKGQAIGLRHIALVDRRKTRDAWWTSQSAGLVMSFPSRAAAEARAAGISQGDPRVVRIETVRRLVAAQAKAIDALQARSA